jgi:hypothetical protein
MPHRRPVVLLLVALILAVSAGREQRAAAQQPARPNLSGFWGAGHAVPVDPALVAKLPPNTVVVPDAGAPELPVGNFGGLRLKPAAAAAAKQWRPEHDMTVERVCLPPSIVYSMQGPFPMEIHQGADLIVMRLEYYDMVRIIFMDGRPHPPANAPHTKVGHSVGRWDGTTLVVDTTHLSASTITNNGLDHSDKVHLTERFWLSADGKMLLMQQEFEDPDALENRGARFVGWDRGQDFIYPYECDPSFAANYGKK